MNCCHTWLWCCPLRNFFMPKTECSMLSWFHQYTIIQQLCQKRLLWCYFEQSHPKHVRHRINLDSCIPKKSIFFTEIFLHDGEAFWSEKWPSWPLFLPSPDEKTGQKRQKFAHRPHFCPGFSLLFCYFSRFCKHAKFSKVNAKFSKVVDFFFSTNAFFRLN